MKKVIIIGGGAAGLVSAISAARNGSEVVILEKMNRVGKKILATGNGRCNISNANCDIKYFHGKNKKFALGVLNRFSVNDTIDFFNELGIHIKQESNGKLYPYSDQSSSVLDVLRYEINRLGIKEICSTEVKRINKNNKKFSVLTKDNQKYFCDSVILATGGKASPNLGSNGSGYLLAERLGHRLIEPFPALVQLKLDANYLKRLKGVKFVGNANISINENVLRSEYGEILFTDYGISGPPILQLSRTVAESLKKGKKCIVKLDLFPKYTDEILKNILVQRFNTMNYKTIEDSFVGFINKRLISVIINIASINKEKKCYTINEKECIKLVRILKQWSIPVLGTNSWMQAQVTAGGIDTKDVNPVTLESKLVKGLYLAGEILDIDGDCGGFNLQWAWASGYIAGYNATCIKTI